MRLAFPLYQCAPHSGLQRHLHGFVAAAQRRGHHCRIYCPDWHGEQIPGADLRRLPAKGLSGYRRHARFTDRVRRDLAADPVEAVFGFDPMPGLDFCFPARSCYLEQALAGRGWLYRRSQEFRHFTAAEEAVFAPGGDTHILLLSDVEAELYRRHYRTPPERLHRVSPGVSRDRGRPDDAARRRRGLREALGIDGQDFVLLFVSSDFVARGLDRVIRALARLRVEQPSVNSRLLVVGSDRQRPFRRLAKRLAIAAAVEFLGARDDVSDLMLAADLLVHPALRDAAGVVPLEAVVAGLPAVVTQECACAPSTRESRGGIVLPSPFDQDQLERAVMRMLDGVYRADCRESALLFARLTDLYDLYDDAVGLAERIVSARPGRCASPGAPDS